MMATLLFNLTMLISRMNEQFIKVAEDMTLGYRLKYTLHCFQNPNTFSV